MMVAGKATMQSVQPFSALALALLTGSTLTSRSQAHLAPVSKNHLCVTEGTIEELPGNRLAIDVPKMRAYVNAYTLPEAEARFTYLGPTTKDSPLASGEMRRQFGLKLRAQDACNLVYAMWRIEPESKMVVSVKSNPEEHSSAECGNRGYQNIKPRHATPTPALNPGETHTLRAEMNGAEMRVFADDSLVWEGSVGTDTLRFDGPVGMRSDNVRLQIELEAEPANRQQLPGCRAAESE
jgi:hypothetical protein